MRPSIRLPMLSWDPTMVHIWRPTMQHQCHVSQKQVQVQMWSPLGTNLVLPPTQSKGLHCPLYFLILLVWLLGREIPPSAITNTGALQVASYYTYLMIQVAVLVTPWHQAKNMQVNRKASLLSSMHAAHETRARGHDIFIPTSLPRHGK